MQLRANACILLCIVLSSSRLQGNTYCVAGKWRDKKLLWDSSCQSDEGSFIIVNSMHASTRRTYIAQACMSLLLCVSFPVKRAALTLCPPTSLNKAQRKLGSSMRFCLLPPTMLAWPFLSCSLYHPHEIMLWRRSSVERSFAAQQLQPF